MITREEYLNALELIDRYHQQLDLQNVSGRSEPLNPNLKRGDFVIYNSGSNSQYLTKGKKYRLTGSLWRNRIAIEADNGKRMNTLQQHFIGI